MPERRPTRLAASLTALTGSQAIGRIVRVAYVFVIARYLAPDQVGIYVASIAFYLTLSIFAEAGQGALLGTQVHTSADRDRLLSQSLALTGVTLAITTALGAGYLQLERDATVIAAGSVLLVSLVARTLVGWVRNCFIAVEDVAWIPRYELAFRAAEAVAGIVILQLGGGVLELCCAHSAAWVIEALFCFRLLRARLSPTLQPRLAGVAAFASVSIPFFLSVSALHLFTQIGIVALARLDADPITLGQFGIAMQIIGTIIVVPMMLGTAVMPAITRILQRSAQPAELAELSALIRIVLVASGAVAVAAEALAPWALASLAGPAYRAAGEVFATLCWSLGPTSCVLILVPALNALGKRRIAATIASLMLVAHVGLVLALWHLGPSRAGELSFVAAAIAAAVAANLALDVAAPTPRRGWWVLAGLVVGVMAAIVHLAPLAVELARPVALVAGGILTVLLRIVTRAELHAIAARMGMRSATQ